MMTVAIARRKNVINLSINKNNIFILVPDKQSQGDRLGFLRNVLRKISLREKSEKEFIPQ